MATTAAASRPPPAAARRMSTAGASSPSATSSNSPAISRGATARAAATSRVSASGTPSRRASLLKAAPPVVSLNGNDSRESLATALKAETEEKEKLLVQLQDKDQTVSTLKSENQSLSSALNNAESRLAELYADQSRMEEEMAARIEVTDKLRFQIKELEKEKRDTLRRYNEQTTTFEAERQAFYDNEQHLKSRIQSLTQARKQQQPPVPPSPSTLSVASTIDLESDREAENEAIAIHAKQDMADPEQEPAEMTALKLELSTLSTSHASLQATVALLQSQLVDLKRVNHELQEENESYNILLREKTLNGQFDILRMGGAASGDVSDQSGEDEEAEENTRESISLGRKHSGGSRSTLDPVDELEEREDHIDLGEAPEMDPAFEQREESANGSRESEPISRGARSRHGRKRSSVSAPRGESLANLPITGPGLDLAAELGRAENKDMLDGQAPLEDRTVANAKTRKTKKPSETTRKVSLASEPAGETSGTQNENEYIETLRSEVKSLKDANKALSLYASKIIDRIISQEGFEHVLAADYEKTPPKTPMSATPNSPDPTHDVRPQSAVFSRSTPSTTVNSPNMPPVERLTTFESLRAAEPKPTSPTRANRRSLSFDWKSFSMFGGGEKKPEPPAASLRPLTLKVGSSAIASARKLDTQEDDEDRKERERLNATMKLMGIEKPVESPSSPLPPMLKSFSTPAQGSEPAVQPPSPALTAPQSAVSPTPTSTARFSFFRRSLSLANRSDSSSVDSSAQGSPQPPAMTPHLTQEALEQVEAENSLAALDAQERQLSAEMARGAGGGFTEIVRRSASERRSSRRSGSASTVWSAGMSKHEDGDE